LETNNCAPPLVDGISTHAGVALQGLDAGRYVFEAQNLVRDVFELVAHVYAGVRGDDAVDDRADEAGGSIAGPPRRLVGGDGTAVGVHEHHDERNLQTIYRVFDGPQHGRVDHLTRGAHDKHVTQALIENDLRREAGVGASEENGV